MTGARFGALALARCASLFAAVPVSAAPAPAKVGTDLAPYVPGALLVGFRPGTPAADRAAARAAAGAVAAEPLSDLARDAEIWTLATGRSVVGAMTVLARNPVVRYAEPDYLLETAVTSNDPYYTGGNLWGMYGDATSPSNAFGSQAAEAWDVGAIGSSAVYVGVIDEGIQFDHPDLDGNIWTNPFDPVDGVDNDGNGFIDDEHGWDFVNNDRSIYDAGGDSHGTHVSGTIGGEGGNGIGVAGVNWSVRIISGKFLGTGGGSTSNAVRAVDYMTDLKTRHGLNIVATSNSWGGGGASTALLDAINRGGDAGILFVAAAGNSSSNNDATQNYPSNYQCTTRANGTARGWDCVVAVAAIASNGSLASFSSYGATTVDLGAPGVSINSTVPTNSYASYNGTSMATPHVSGAVALCASLDPTLTANGLRTAVLSATTPTTSLAGITVTGGRLNVGAMLASCSPATGPVSGAPSGLTATTVDSRTISLAWTDGVSDESLYEVQRATSSSGVCGTFATIGTLGPNSTAYTAGGLAGSTTYCFRVRGANGYAGGSQSAWSNTDSATTAAPPPPYVCATTAIAWIDPTGGTSYALSDDASASFSIPFGFSAYGTTYTTGSVSSNGYVRLGSGAATAYANVGIPNVADPNMFLAAFWDDLNPASVSGTVRTRVDGTAPNRRFVASWVNVPHFSVAGSALTFQIVLEEATGDVVFQYLDVIAGSATYDRGASATIGLEDALGETGTQIALNSAVLSDGSAYRCSTSVAPPIAPTIAATTFADGTIGTAYSASQSASGGVTPYTWSIASGALPAGLTMNPSTGAITGNPTTAGTATFTVKVQGADTGSSTRTASIRVDAPLAISAATLSATAGTAYAQTITTTGGRSPIAWSRSGTLPTGVSFSGGSFSGTPTVSGSYPITITATDDVGRVATRDFTLTVAFGKMSPANGARTALRTSATLEWSAHQGATQYRYCVSTAKTCTPSTTTSATGVTVSGVSAN
ncbi:MAG: S8 family serine peptidase [Actinomycetota bacterium]